MEKERIRQLEETVAELRMVLYGTLGVVIANTFVIAFSR